MGIWVDMMMFGLGGDVNQQQMKQRRKVICDGEERIMNHSELPALGRDGNQSKSGRFMGMSFDFTKAGLPPAGERRSTPD